MSKTRQKESDFLVGVDIGTSKVAVVIGEVKSNRSVHVVGFGLAPCRGLKRGVVINIEATVAAIRSAISKAEEMACYSVDKCYAGIAGGHVRSLNSHGVVAICDQEVSKEDINRVIDAARAVVIPSDQQILHILPKEYTIDEQSGIKEPSGMSGVRLQARVHIVFGAENAVQNIVKCIQYCELNVTDIILEQLASSYAVLTEDEKELGVCLIDIGGGTTDIAIFTAGSISHTIVVPIAGDQVTNDIAVAFRTPTDKAEDLKISYGVALPEFTSETDQVPVISVGNRPVRKILSSDLATVCSARFEEIFRIVRNEVTRAVALDSLTAGIVLTGGASQMKGVSELAESIFQLPVRFGVPERVTGLVDIMKNPCFSTGIGLLLYGDLKRHDSPDYGGFSLRRLSFWSRLRSWFLSTF